EANAPFDYQLGGGYTPAAGVEIVTRDRQDSPAPGLYNICYVNGFQTQPQDNDRWLADNADLVLHDASGAPVIDEDWGEYLLDTSSVAKRSQLTQIVGGWIAQCAADGFDAVEIDNLDSYSRSAGLLVEDDNVSFMASLSAVAHAHGLAIGQKNSAELVPRAGELGTDFAVAEECNRYDECDAYTAHYGAHVLSIEYRKQDFDKGCQAFPDLSIVLRDLELTTPLSSQYVYDGC
ncbi:MAG TPA: endo alpha-1,4 polygalactosaminidase, partial [Polyangiaceae bacterium]|nr:endo alpha-1,4 polygalactosaminidase [Polyangiaceae bacterium]